MNLLLDTQILLWVAFKPAKLPRRMQAAISDLDNTVYFSTTAIWETSIKSAAGREDFQCDPHALRRQALRQGYRELAVTGDHALQVASLPLLHKDPFDRILIAQAQFEHFVLLTADALVRRYPYLQLF